MSFAAFAQVASNLAFLFPISVAVVLGYQDVAVQLLLTLISSTGYHLCSSTSVCLLGLTLDRWTLLDYIFAIGGTIIVFICQVMNAMSVMVDAYKSDHMDAQDILNEIVSTQTLATLLRYGIIVLVLSNIGPSLDATKIVIMLSSLAVVMKVIFIDGSARLRLGQKFHVRIMLSALVNIAIGIVLFLIGEGALYNVTHPIWHVEIAVGLGLWMIGTSHHIHTGTLWRRIWDMLCRPGARRIAAIEQDV